MDVLSTLRPLVTFIFVAMLANASLLGQGSTQPAEGPAGDTGAAGGGAVADFDSLMTLIQSTVAPDSWDSVGGNSTMQPYFGGVRVKGDEAITEEAATSAQLANLRAALEDRSATPDDADWRAPARIRVVSLKRLAHALQDRFESKQSPDEAMLQLAGISRIRCLVWDSQREDVLIAGTVGGFIVDGQEGLRDRRTGAPPIHLTDFAAALAAGLKDQSFGCSIDPTPAGIAAAQQVAARGLPGKDLPTALTEAMGFHHVSLFGVGSDAPIGVTLVAADLHVKQLVLGKLAGPPEFDDYFDVVQSTIDEGPPGGELLRFWFAPRPIAMRTDPTGEVFSWSELPMRLLSEREMADADGRRQAVGGDARATTVAQSFTDNIDDLCRQYPIYHRLASVFEAAMCGALLQREAGRQRAADLLGPLADPESWIPSVATPPGRVTPLVVQRQIRHRRNRHQITVISGGVRVAGSETLPDENATKVYASLSSLGQGMQKGAPADAPGRWWWNAE